MAGWQLVIVSGSDAQLNSLAVGSLPASSGVGHVSASLFSGSFYGNGSGLTNVGASATDSEVIHVYLSADSTPAITTTPGTITVPFDVVHFNSSGTVFAMGNDGFVTCSADIRGVVQYTTTVGQDIGGNRAAAGAYLEKSIGGAAWEECSGSRTVMYSRSTSYAGESSATGRVVEDILDGTAYRVRFYRLGGTDQLHAKADACTLTIHDLKGGEQGPSGSAGAASAGGSDTEIQFNNSNVLDGNANFVYDDTNSRVGINIAPTEAPLHIQSENKSSIYQGIYVKSTDSPLQSRPIEAHYFDDSTSQTSLFSGIITANDNISVPNNLSSIIFDGLDDGGATRVTYGAVHVIQTDHSAGSEDSGMAFGLQLNGTFGIKATLDNAGLFSATTFAGSGVSLTNLPVQTFTNGGSDRLVTATGTDGITGEDDLTYTPATDTLAGISASFGMVGAGLIINVGDSFLGDAAGDGFTVSSNAPTFTNILSTGTGNEVIVNHGSGVLRTQTIDPIAWSGGGAISGTGTNDRIALWSGTSTVDSDADLTYDGATLTVDGAVRVTGMVSASLVSADLSNITSTTGTLLCDLRLGNTIYWVMDEDADINFSSPQIGTVYNVIIVQPSSGGPHIITGDDWSVGTDVWFPAAAGAPVLSSGANEVDMVSMVYDGAKLIAVYQSNFVKVP